MALSIQDKIDHAKIILFRKDFNLQFFGLTLYNFTWEVVDFGHDRVIATIKLSKDYGDASKIKKQIFLNKRFVERDDYTPINLVFDLWHEILHFIHKHGIRINNKNKEIANLAFDHIVDNIISKNSNIKPYNDKYNIINSYADRNWSEEQVYNALFDEYNNNRLNYTVETIDIPKESEEGQESNCPTNSGDGDSDSIINQKEKQNDESDNQEDSDGDSNDPEDSEGSGDESNNEIKSQPSRSQSDGIGNTSETNEDQELEYDDDPDYDDLDNSDDEFEENDDSDDDEFNSDKYLKDLSDSIENDETSQFSNIKTTEFKINRQTITITTIEEQKKENDYTNPSELDDELIQEELHDNILKDIKVLFQMIKSKPESCPYSIKAYLDKLLEVELDWRDIYERALKNQIKYQFSGVSWKRINPKYTHLKVTLPVQNNQKKDANKLNIFLDVSGSITRKQKRQFGHVSYSAFNYFEEITIYYHNTRIVDSKSFSKSDNKQTFLNYISENAIPDGGGTSHQFCFEQIKKDIDEGKSVSLSIFLTDGESDIDQMYYHFESSIKTHPMIFLISDNKRFRLSTDNKLISIIHI